MTTKQTWINADGLTLGGGPRSAESDTGEKSIEKEVGLNSPQLNALASIHRSPAGALKAQTFGLSQIGFNSYELIYRNLTHNPYTFGNMLTYFGECRSNLVRVLYPVYSTAEWTSLVFSNGVPSGEINDSHFLPTFLTRTDAVISAAESAGVRLQFCLFWSVGDLVALFGETIVQGVQTSSQSYNFMQRFSRWFFARYGGRPVLAAYSFFNELTYDATGVSAPTPANYGAVITGLTAIGRELAPQSIATSDFTFLTLDISQNKVTPASQFTNIKTIAASLDTLGIHIYGYGPSQAGHNFVGSHGATTAALGPGTGNTLGFEGLETIACAWRSIADSLGMPLWVTECGVPTDVDSTTTSLRRRQVLSTLTRYADQVLIWNAADVASPIANQVVWQIRPGQPLGDTYKTLVLEANTGRVRSGLNSGGGTTALRVAAKPQFRMSGARSAGATVRVTSTAAMATTTQAVLFWFRRDAANNNFENYLYARDAGGLFGFLALAGANAAADADYIEFRGAAGAAGNISGRMPRLPDNEWHHIAYQFRTMNGQIAIEYWLNGLYMGVIAASSAYAPITAATTIYVCGGSVNGAPVSMQDVALAASITTRDVAAHMAGEVLPQSVLHLRADSQTVLDLSRSNVAVTVGAGASVGIA